MPRSLPFHSVKPGTSPVFHNNDACLAGRLIEPVNWRAGDGGRELCAQCAELNVAGL